MSTIGEYRVGISFNPGKSSDVDIVKARTADAINDLQPIVDLGGEAGRCAKIAQEQYEDAAMWAVKAITKPPR